MKVAQWTNSDSASLREFLGRPSGQNFLASLRMRLQPMAAKTFEETALNARFRDGQEDILEGIDVLMNHNEKAETETNTFVNTNDSPR